LRSNKTGNDFIRRQFDDSLTVLNDLPEDIVQQWHQFERKEGDLKTMIETILRLSNGNFCNGILVFTISLSSGFDSRKEDIEERKRKAKNERLSGGTNSSASDAKFNLLANVHRLKQSLSIEL
jgi:hypothetical protein